MTPTWKVLSVWREVNTFNSIGNIVGIMHVIPEMNVQNAYSDFVINFPIQAFTHYSKSSFSFTGVHSSSSKPFSTF